MAENHIIKVKYSPKGSCRTRSVFQYDYGQILQFENFTELPAVFEVHFAKPGVDETIPMIGENNIVRVPDECVMQKPEAKAWLFLHDDVTDGETRFVITIPVVERNAITNSEPTEQEHDIISEAIVVLNRAVETTEEAKNTTLEAEEHVVSMSAAIDEIYDETIAARDDALDAAERADSLTEQARQYAEDAAGSASDASDTLAEVNILAQQAETSSNNAQEYARQAHASMETAAGSESNAALSQRQTHEDMLATAAIRTEVAGLKEDVSDLKDDVTLMRSDVFQKTNEAAASATSASESASAAAESVQEAQETAESVIATTSASAEAAARSANTASTAATNASSYAIRAENAVTSAESAATRSSTNANNANRYASNARSYAASAERYAADAEAAKEEAERISLAQNMAIAPIEDNSAADKAYNVGDYFVYDNKLYQVTAAIAKDESIIPGTNCELTTVMEEMKDIQTMDIHICTAGEYNAETGVPTIQNPDSKTFYLVPGGDTPNLYVEWVYTNNAWEQFGSATIDLSNYVQKTDYATNDAAGVVKINPNVGITVSNGILLTNPALQYEIKEGINAFKPLSVLNQHLSVFYGLAKAAGDATQSASDNTVGTYTVEAKTAIHSMLGAASSNIVAVQDNQPNDAENKLWVKKTLESGVDVPTYAEFTSGLAEKVGFTDYATNNTAGVVKVGNGLDVSSVADGNKLQINPAREGDIKDGFTWWRAIVPHFQQYAVFYGLATAAGDSTQSASSNAVGTYTAAAQTAIQTMLGVQPGIEVVRLI